MLSAEERQRIQERARRISRGGWSKTDDLFHFVGDIHKLLAALDEAEATLRTHEWQASFQSKYEESQLTLARLQQERDEFISACLMARGWYEGRPDAALEEIEHRAKRLQGGERRERRESI